MKVKTKHFETLFLLGVSSFFLTTDAVALSAKTDIGRKNENINYCATQPDGYIYNSKINNSCKKSRELVTGHICWKCNDKCKKKTHPYTEEDCIKQGLKPDGNMCTTIDNIKRYKTCKCDTGYYPLSEINYDTSLFEYEPEKETKDGKVKCYRPSDCKNKKKITTTSGLTIENNYAWKNPCSKLKIVSSHKDQTREDNFYCAINVECNKSLNCYKNLDDKDCVEKEFDDSAADFYDKEDNKCYFYKGCLYSDTCVKENINDCINIQSIPISIYDKEAQKTGNAICRKFIHGENGCIEGFSLTKKFLCTNFDKTPHTSDNIEVDSISYDTEERIVNGFRQSCKKYVECKFGYEEYKPEARGTLTVEDIEKASEGGSYQVSFVKGVNGDKEDYIICRKYTGCATNKCDISCENENSWMRYFMPRKQ